MVSLSQEMMPAVKQLTAAGGLPALLTISAQGFDLAAANKFKLAAESDFNMASLNHST